MKLKTFSIVSKGDAGWPRAIYGIDGTTCAPLVYLRKPKWLHPDDFKRVCDAIQLNMLSGAEMRTTTDEELVILKGGTMIPPTTDEGR